MHGTEKHIWGRTRLAGLVVLLGTVAGSGCVTLKDFCFKEHAPKGTPCQVVVRWEPEVIHTPDPTRGGAPNPGFACRVYLFGPSIDYPLGCEGSVLVELFDVTGGATPTKPLETWEIDPLTLERLSRKDAIGWGYTLFLPWGTIKPEIREVRMRTRFSSIKGQALYHDSGPIKLHTAPVAMGPKGAVPAMPGQPPVKPQNSPLPPPTPLPSLPAPRPTTQGTPLTRAAR